MEENHKRNQLREARIKLDKTRKNLGKVAREQQKMMKARYRMSEVELEE